MELMRGQMKTPFSQLEFWGFLLPFQEPEEERVRCLTERKILEIYRTKFGPS